MRVQVGRLIFDLACLATFGNLSDVTKERHFPRRFSGFAQRRRLFPPKNIAQRLAATESKCRILHEKDRTDRREVDQLLIELRRQTQL
jgi:hypothetical protein